MRVEGKVRRVDVYHYFCAHIKCHVKQSYSPASQPSMNETEVPS